MSGQGYIEIIKKSIQLLALIENTEPIRHNDKELESLKEIRFIAEELRSKINQHVMSFTGRAIIDGVCPAELQIYAEERGWTSWIATK